MLIRNKLILLMDIMDGHYPVKWKTQFIVDQLSKHPDWRICLEIEPETWDTVQIQTPGAYRQLKNVVVTKQVEFTNPTYAQPYCYNISGESIIRQFQYGIAKINKHFPGVTFTTYSVEEPCFTSYLVLSMPYSNARILVGEDTLTLMAANWSIG